MQEIIFFDDIGKSNSGLESFGVQEHSVWGQQKRVLVMSLLYLRLHYQI